MPNITQITPPRVPLIDERTKLISREWYRFFLNLYTLTGSGTNDTSISDLMVAPTQTDQSGNFTYTYDQAQMATLPATPIQIGTMGQVNLTAVPYMGFVTTTAAYSVPTSAPVGLMWWNGSVGTLNLSMGGAGHESVTQQIGEELYIYGRASDDISGGGLVIQRTGTDGVRGITFAPAAAGLTDPNLIIGVSTERIDKNEYGLITLIGVVHDLNTASFADGDSLWYNPSVATGAFTATAPSAPGLKVQVGTVIKAAGGTNGSIQVLIGRGSVLGGTDSNVQFSALNNGDLIQYNSSGGYWLNTPATSIAIGTATNLAGGAKNQIPYQSTASATVFMTAPTSSTYLNYTGSAFAWTTTIPIANGGTGANTATSAFDALAPTTTRGDLIYYATNNTRLAIGTTGQVLQVNTGATAPTWTSVKTVAGSSIFGTGDLGTIPIAYGGTSGVTAVSGFNNLAPTTTAGDMIYRGATDNTRLAIGTTNQIMQSTGTTPQWATTTGSGLVVRNTYPTFTSSIGVGGATAAAGQGVTFVSTTTGANSSDVNTLDFYEEGTWTPTLTINNTTTGIAYSTAVGRYTRVGNFIQAQAYFVLTDKGTTTGNVRVTGFPFASANITNYNQGGNIAFYSNLTAINGGVVNGYIGPNARVMTLVTPASALNTMANLSATQVTSSMAMVLSIGYTTNT